jgi:hypothetical protein
MKKILISLLLVVLATTCFANPKDWFDANADKFGHALAGGFVAGVSYKHGANNESMVANAAIVGFLKEVFDFKYKKKWDNWDWIATILGGVVFVAL